MSNPIANLADRLDPLTAFNDIEQEARAAHTRAKARIHPDSALYEPLMALLNDHCVKLIDLRQKYLDGAEHDMRIDNFWLLKERRHND